MISWEVKQWLDQVYLSTNVNRNVSMMHPVVALTLEKVGVKGSVISIMAKIPTLDPTRVLMDIAKTRIAVIYFFIFTDSSLNYIISWISENTIWIFSYYSLVMR